MKDDEFFKSKGCYDSFSCRQPFGMESDHKIFYYHNAQRF